MKTLTFDCMRQILEGNKADMQFPIIAQWKQVILLNGRAVHANGKLSWGNFYWNAVISTKTALKQKEKGHQIDYTNYDVISFTDYEINHKKENDIIVIRGDIKIFEPRVPGPIGNPVNYYDCSLVCEFPTPSKENIIISSAKALNEESKTVPTSSEIPKAKYPIKLNKSGMLEIRSLTTYCKNWTVIAKITKKYPVRTFIGRAGPWRLFNLELTDYSGQIMVTGFNETVDQFYENLKQGETYKISGCDVQIANKRISSIKNDYCLVLTKNSVFSPCENSLKSISETQVNVFSIQQVLKVEEGHFIDFMGIFVCEMGVKEVGTRIGIRYIRKMVFVDNSTPKDLNEGKVAGIYVNMWGYEPDKVEFEEGTLYVIKRAKVQIYNETKTVIWDESDEIIDISDLKNHKEAVALQKWFENRYIHSIEKLPEIVQNYSKATLKHSESIPNTFIKSAIQNNLEVFSVYGTIEHIKTDETCIYPACPDWKRKLTQTLSYGFQCTHWAWDQVKPVFSFLIGFKFWDPTGWLFMNCFREAAQDILGGMTPTQYQDKIKEVSQKYRRGKGDYTDFMNKELGKIGAEHEFKEYRVMVIRSEVELANEIRTRFTAVKVLKCDSLDAEMNVNLKTLNAFQIKNLQNSMSKLSI